MELTFDPSAPARARAFSWGVLASWGAPEARREDVGLAVSELVANAIRHARPPLRIRVTDERTHVLVEVCDGSSEAPQRRNPTPRDMDGRGLRIVESLALCWGWRRHVDGKCIWCEVSVTQPDR
jgi:anti-sigma regulatory factor (Ser/Thr protein kinase)